MWWLIAAIVLTAGSVVIFARGLRGPAVEITVADDAMTRLLATASVPGLTRSRAAAALPGPSRSQRPAPS